MCYFKHYKLECSGYIIKQGAYSWGECTLSNDAEQWVLNLSSAKKATMGVQVMCYRETCEKFHYLKIILSLSLTI